MAKITVDNVARQATITNSNHTFTLVRVHDAMACAGRGCALHNPSDHHMRDWDIVVREDKGSLFERICSHGVGHPDPDSLAYFIANGDDWMGVHGCDGCCHGRED